MKRVTYLCLIFLGAAITLSFAEGQGLLIDDFEGIILGGTEGTVDFGAGNGSQVEVAAETDIKYSGKQSIKVTYDAVSDGYMWVARGSGLDAKDAGWLVKPEEIKWNEYSAIAFSVYGNESKTKVAFDIKDNGHELWRFMFEDDFKGWKRIVCPFQDFFVRGDWQPDNADKNGILDFPIQSFQFEPRPEAKGTLYFDGAELVKQ